MKQVSFRLPNKIREELDDIAAERGVPLSEVVRVAIEWRIKRGA